MTDFGLTFQQRYFDRINKYYNQLTDNERDRLIYLKNMADKIGKLSAHDFNQLKELAESLINKR
jgi:hypothetical protein